MTDTNTEDRPLHKSRTTGMRAHQRAVLAILRAAGEDGITTADIHDKGGFAGGNNIGGTMLTLAARGLAEQVSPANGRTPATWRFVRAPPVEHVGRVIGKACDKSGESQATIAQASGIDPGRLSIIIHGKAEPTAAELAQLDVIFSLRPGSLAEYAPAPWCPPRKDGYWSARAPAAKPARTRPAAPASAPEAPAHAPREASDVTTTFRVRRDQLDALQRAAIRARTARGTGKADASALLREILDGWLKAPVPRQIPMPLAQPRPETPEPRPPPDSGRALLESEIAAAEAEADVLRRALAEDAAAAGLRRRRRLIVAAGSVAGALAAGIALAVAL